MIVLRAPLSASWNLLSYFHLVDDDHEVPPTSKFLGLEEGQELPQTWDVQLQSVFIHVVLTYNPCLIMQRLRLIHNNEIT